MSKEPVPKISREAIRRSQNLLKQLCNQMLVFPPKETLYPKEIYSLCYYNTKGHRGTFALYNTLENAKAGANKYLEAHSWHIYKIKMNTDFSENLILSSAQIRVPQAKCDAPSHDALSCLDLKGSDVFKKATTRTKGALSRLMGFDDFDLSFPIQGLLKKNTVDLMRLKHLGRKTLFEINDRLAEHKIGSCLVCGYPAYGSDITKSTFQTEGRSILLGNGIIFARRLGSGTDSARCWQ